MSRKIRRKLFIFFKLLFPVVDSTNSIIDYLTSIFVDDGWHLQGHDGRKVRDEFLFRDRDRRQNYVGFPHEARRASGEVPIEGTQLHVVRSPWQQRMAPGECLTAGIGFSLRSLRDVCRS